MLRHYDKKNKRILYFDRPADAEFWDNNWKSVGIFREVLFDSQISQWAIFTEKFLTPQMGPILEGGCGTGIHVASLHRLGFDVVGVDFAERTVNTLKNIAPELDIQFGDVRELQFNDDFFAGYWSLGVIEHFWDGYEQIAIEMYRVLKPGGILFLAFPFMNPIRKLKSFLRIIKTSDKNVKTDFYQFALNPDYVVSDFQKLGFRLLDKLPILGRQGLQEEMLYLYKLIQMAYGWTEPSFYKRCLRAFFHRLNQFMFNFSSYSILLVFQK